MSDEIQIWNFGELEEKDEDDLHMTDGEKAEVNDKYFENPEFVYAEDDVAVLVKVVIKTLMPYITHNGIKNEVFSLNRSTDSKDIPNFAYNGIKAFWNNNIEDDFKVVSNRKIDLHDIAKINNDCFQSLKK